MSSNCSTSFLRNPCPLVQILYQNTVACMLASSEPSSHLLLWEINSGTVVGTSVEALADLTYLRVHASFFFVTISKQRIRSSARYMFLSNKPASVVPPCIASPLK